MLSPASATVPADAVNIDRDHQNRSLARTEGSVPATQHTTASQHHC